MTTNSEPQDGRTQARKYLRIAVTIIALEALIYMVFGIIAIVSLSSKDATSSIGIGLFLLAYGFAQLFAGSKLLQWHTRARGPLVFTQLIQVGLAWGLRDSDRQWLGIVMATSAVIALGCLLAPAVTRALIDEGPV